MHIERIEPNTKEWKLYYANHIYRYEFANKVLKKNSCSNILDIASGVGYGTNYLAENRYEKITGVDISEDSLDIAEKKFSHKNINFVKDDCNNLKTVNQQKYNGIVSFETLEHLTNFNYFVKELYHLLSDNGILIISTPNILVTEHYSKDDWHYHEKEFTPQEFYDLLKDVGFNSVKLFGQKYTQTGLLRNEIRHEINVLSSNPFTRFGMWLQKIKGRNFDYPLPEKKSDFEINELSVNKCTEQADKGPFVLIITAKK